MHKFQEIKNDQLPKLYGYNRKINEFISKYVSNGTPLIVSPGILETKELQEKMPYFLLKSRAVKFYQLAEFTAMTFSKDPNTKQACLLLTAENLRILSTGYTSIPLSLKDTKNRWKEPEKYKWVTHADASAIANAAKTGISVDGCLVVTTLFPCIGCARSFIQIGIKIIVTAKPDFNDYKWGGESKFALKMFKEANILVYYVTINNKRYHVIKAT